MPAPKRRSLAVLVALAAACLQCTRPAPAPASRPGVSVFTNFTLVDGTDRAPLSPAAMVVDQGRIAWVGPAAELGTHAPETPSDLTGTFVIPGLVNLHAHLGNTVDITQDRKFHTRESVEQNLRTFAAYGVTTTLSMGTDQDVVLPIRQEQRASGRPSMARLFTTGQGLVFTGGYGGLAGVNEPVATVAAAEAAVAAQAAKKVDAIKLWLDDELGTMPRMPAAISKAIIDAAHRHKLRALAHVFYLADARRLVDQGIDGFVHSVRDKPLDAPLVAAMKARGVWQVSATLSREASFAFGANPPFAADPFFTRGVSETTLKLFTNPERLKTIAAGPNYTRYPAFFEMAKANLKRLADGGIRIGFGTDTGPPGRFAGYFEHWELELMVDAGLTPKQVLSAATRDAAAFLGATTEFGTIEASKWADFVVLDADPIANIRNTRAIRAVYIAGSKVPAITEAR